LEVLPYVRLSPVRVLALIVIASLGVGAGVAAVRTRPETFQASARIAVNVVYPIPRFELEGKASSIQSALRTDDVLQPAATATGTDPTALRRAVKSEVTVGGTAITLTYESTAADTADAVVSEVAEQALLLQTGRDMEVAQAALESAERRVDDTQAALDRLVAPFGSSDLENLSNTLDDLVRSGETTLAGLTSETEERRPGLEALQAQRIADRAAVQDVLPAWTRLANRLDDQEDVRRAAERTLDEAAGRVEVVNSGRGITAESATAQPRTQAYLRAGLAIAACAIAAALLLMALTDGLRARRRERITRSSRLSGVDLGPLR
jgi:hypothetical protein